LKTQTPVFTLPGLLVRAAEADHDRVAVSGDSAHLTYGELEDRSSQLAAALVDLNVRPGDRVVVVAGVPVGRPGQTNLLKVESV